MYFAKCCEIKGKLRSESFGEHKGHGGGWGMCCVWGWAPFLRCVLEALTEAPILHPFAAGVLCGAQHQGFPAWDPQIVWREVAVLVNLAEDGGNVTPGVCFLRRADFPVAGSRRALRMLIDHCSALSQDTVRPLLARAHPSPGVKEKMSAL